MFHRPHGFYKNFNHASSMIAHKSLSWTRVEGDEIMFRMNFLLLLAQPAKKKRNTGQNGEILE